MTQIDIKITQLPHGDDLALPEYATAGSAGCDLLAAVSSEIVMGSMERQLIPTGIAIALPEGYEAQIRPRSGLAFKHGISVVNAPGTIDSDYRGEIKVLLINLGDEPFTVTRGMRVAQMVITPVSQAKWQKVEVLEDTKRSDAGFGSTGTHAKKVETA